MRRSGRHTGRREAEGFYATDDAALIEHYGGLIRIIEGSYQNLKVTTMEDVGIAEKYLNARREA